MDHLSRDRSLSGREILIINLPAFSFLMLIPLGWGLYLYTGLIFCAVLGVVWGISGFILLLHDYHKRKRDVYLRLTKLYQGHLPRHFKSYLDSTFCGMCMVRALSYRQK